MIITPKRSNDTPKSIKLSEVAKLVGGELVGDRDLVITGVAGIKEAEKGDITFLTNVRYLPFLAQTRASAVVMASSQAASSGGDKAIIRTESPSLAFAKIASFFMPQEQPAELGVHSTAVIGKNVHLGESVSVGAHAVVEEGSYVGERSSIGAGCYIGPHVQIGHDVRLYPHVTIREQVKIGHRVIIHSNSVIGSDGFGYETVDGKHLKIPQVGSVDIEDDVEIGSCACIDRGRFKNTRIGRGTKIDNLVQIAHNVVLGQDCLIVSQVGISGSTELGDRVVVAGQAGIVGHVMLGEDVIVGARSGVSKSIPSKTIVLGEPARPIQEQKRLLAFIARLPEFFKDLAQLKKKNP